MKLEHTPGPWELSGRLGTNVVSVNSPVAITEIWVREGWEADARLIAAAPELLEALINVILDWRNSIDDATWYPASDAIIKATGKTWEELNA